MKSPPIRRALLAAAAALVLSAAQAHAQDATIQAASGRISIRADGQKLWVAAKAGDALLVGDALKTGAKSIAHVSLAGGSTLLVQENSIFKLEGTVEAAQVRFDIGEFLIGVRKILKGRGVRVRTPAAVAAVRGTLFWGKTDTGRTTTFAGFGGVITVRAKGKTIRLKPGETTTVRYGEPPSDPARHNVPKSYLKTFEVDGGLAGADALADPALP